MSDEEGEGTGKMVDTHKKGIVFCWEIHGLQM
jgi:hypothetical protein